MRHTPYFYIIRHKVTNKSYAGSRRAVGCHPDELMEIDGYTTSSTIINDIIKTEGIQAFDIICIITEFGALTALEFETKFLIENDCAGSVHWLNCHNNGILSSWGSPEWKSMMYKLYGVESFSSTQEWKDTTKKQNIEKYGVEWYFQTNEFKEALKKTMLLRHGVDSYNKTDEFREKCISTWMSTLGVSNPSQSEYIKEKKRLTVLENYGVDHYSKTDEFKIKIKNTYKERTGYEWGTDPIQIEKRTKTSMDNHGGIFHTQTDEFRDARSKQKTEFWADPNNKTKMSKIYTDAWTDERKAKVTEKARIKREMNKIRGENEPPLILCCPYCDFSTKSKDSYRKRHGNKCKHNPINQITQ